MDNPGYEKTILEGKLGPFMTEEECFLKCEKMRHRLIGRCHGLLEVGYTGYEFPLCHRL